jgi:hypothetical protein
MPLDTRTLQAYLGHRSIGSTTRYAALAPGRFKNIWGNRDNASHHAAALGRRMPLSTLTDFLAVFVAAGAIIVIGIAVVILNTRS